VVSYFIADVVSANDYSAFGAPLAGRTFTAPNISYRFGFNGKENDDETQTQDYGMRIYDFRLGKFLSVDPLTQSYPWNSTYAFAENDVISCIDLDGLEKLKAIDGVTIVDGPYDISKINSSEVVKANIVKQRAMNQPPPIPKFNPKNSVNTNKIQKSSPVKATLAITYSQDGGAGFKVNAGAAKIELIDSENEIDIVGFRDNKFQFGGGEYKGYQKEKHTILTGNQSSRDEFSFKVGEFGFAAKKESGSETQVQGELFGFQHNFTTNENKFELGGKLIIPIFNLGIDASLTFDLINKKKTNNQDGGVKPATVRAQ
jgi:RHS repeat-associated protein